CIKVDREERPDIDSIYMTALQAADPDQRGGWPLSMFLTADAKPIFGFTYRPADDKVEDGRIVMRGFKSILKAVKKVQADKPKELLAQAEVVAARTKRDLDRATIGIALVELDRKLVAEAVENIEEGFDKTYGGFGSADRGFRGPKF